MQIEAQTGLWDEELVSEFFSMAGQASSRVVRYLIPGERQARGAIGCSGPTLLTSATRCRIRGLHQRSTRNYFGNDLQHRHPGLQRERPLRATLDKVLAHIERHGWDAEILVVNDGSTDDTAQNCRDLRHAKSRGSLAGKSRESWQGLSVRNGMLHACNGELILFSDADLSSPIEEANKLFAAIQAGANIAMGSRWLRAELQTQRQPIHRQLFGRISTSPCGSSSACNIATPSAGSGLHPPRRTPDLSVAAHRTLGFDPEILYLAASSGSRWEKFR